MHAVIAHRWSPIRSPHLQKQFRHCSIPIRGRGAPRAHPMDFQVFRKLEANHITLSTRSIDGKQWVCDTEDPFFIYKFGSHIKRIADGLSQEIWKSSLEDLCLLPVRAVV